MSSKLETEEATADPGTSADGHRCPTTSADDYPAREDRVKSSRTWRPPPLHPPSRDREPRPICRCEAASLGVCRTIAAPRIIPRVAHTCDDGCHARAIERFPRVVRLPDLALTFEVSRDEEYVHLRMACEQRDFDMGARTHNYLLLTLARRRLADASAHPLDASCGWIYQDEFEHDPTMAAPQLNVHIFRIRRHFIRCGVIDGEAIVERRPQTRQLRIGAARISIVAA
jgi:hypothetical protein